MPTTADGLKKPAADAIPAAAKTYMSETASLGKTYFDAWVATAQAGLRSAFDIQNAAMQTSRVMFDAAVQADRFWLDQAAESVRKSQDAAAKLASVAVGLAESGIPNGRA